jgi:dihydrolipoamide dehydrogenase
VGCIPSKALLDSSRQFHNLTHMFGDHGISAEDAEDRCRHHGWTQGQDRQTVHRRHHRAVQGNKVTALRIAGFATLKPGNRVVR